LRSRRRRGGRRRRRSRCRCWWSGRCRLARRCGVWGRCSGQPLRAPPAWSHSFKNRTGEWTGEVTGSLVHRFNRWLSRFSCDKKPLNLINYYANLGKY
jgi:hypothetical protein